VQEVVLDELVVGVEGEGLVVDVPLLRVGADHQARHAQAVAVGVHGRRCDVIVEAAPVVPGQDQARRVLTDLSGRGDPGDRRESARLRGAVEGVQRLDVALLVVGLDRVEVRQRVPDAIYVVRARE
jgi:hypothetical protein